MVRTAPITSWAALKAKLLDTDNVFSDPVNIKCDVIDEVPNNLQHVIFKRCFSITESEFKSDVDFSFCTFEQGINLTGSRFKGKVNFRAAHVKCDLVIPLAVFEEPACFDDIHVSEVLNAEGCVFKKAAEFNRINASKSTIFCCALLSDGKAVQTEFKGETNFNDAHFKGPVYFNGAHFYDKVFFNRSHADSSAFFNCDLLETETDSSQPRHKEYVSAKLQHGVAKPRFFVTTFDDMVSFVGAKIGGSVSFSGAQFGKKPGPATAPATIPGARADFRRIQIEGTALFDPLGYTDTSQRSGFNEDFLQRVVFNYDALFWNASIKGAARFESVYFGGEANFEHVQIGRRAYFNPVEYKGKLICSEFRGMANFRDAEIKGTVGFMSAQFLSDADFERLTTDGSMYFRPFEDEKLTPVAIREQKFEPVRFAGSVRFVGCRVRGNAEFDSAAFENTKPEDENDFSRMEVGGNIYFRPWSVKDKVVKFAKKVWFTGAQIKGTAKFSGTEFGDDADFSDMRVNGDAYFDSQLRNEETDDSYEGQPIEPVKFRGVAKFNGATFLTLVSFKKARFEKEAIFTGVRCDGEVSFEGARFKSAAIFREARLTSLKFDRVQSTDVGWSIYLSSLLSWQSLESYLKSRLFNKQPEQQFADQVDLIGCTYDRIDVELKDLMQCMRRTSQAESGNGNSQEYNRQPYTQMSKTLLTNGYDRRAEFVYVEQRHREREATWMRLKSDLTHALFWRSFRGSANFLGDCFLWAVAKYGVQVERLVVISIAVILIGSGIFSLKGAVQPSTPQVKATIKREARQTTTANATTEPPLIFETTKQTDEETKLKWPDALAVSVSQFLPVVDIPSGSKWKPAQQSFFHVYGSIHRVCGAILIPLLLAALAASLYRRFKSNP
ncbi:MAG TPA: pentapeptide repeat-containing protein [Pyrinomonadaceae bacterium]|jgi:hypothetical protein